MTLGEYESQNLTGKSGILTAWEASPFIARRMSLAIRYPLKDVEDIDCLVLLIPLVSSRLDDNSLRH